MSGDDKRRSGSQLLSIRGADLLIAVVFAFVAAALVELLPEEQRSSAAASVLVFLLVISAIIFTNSRREARRRHSGDFIVNASTGVLTKGVDRNIAIREDSFEAILDAIADHDSAIQASLVAVGLKTGQSWGQQLVHLCEHKFDAEEIVDRFAIWQKYDAEAGLGRFEFDRLSPDGVGMITLRNSILSGKSHNEVPLDYFFEGYVRGTLAALITAGDRVVKLVPASGKVQFQISYPT